MTTSRHFSRSARLAALLAAGAVLLATAHDASAKGSGNSADRGGMTNSDSSRNSADRDRMKSAESGRGRDRSDMVSQRDKDKDGDRHSRKYKDRDGDKDRYAEKHKQRCGQIIVPTKGCPANPKDPVGNTRPDPSKGPAASNNPAPGTGSTNSGKPAQPPAGTPTTTGKLPPNDPVGNTHPTLGGDVTVSNGVTTTILRGASSGVLVQSLEPGKIIVRGDNGQEATLLGGSVTVTGAAIVGSGQGIERLNRPNGDVTLAVGPGIAYPVPAAPPAPSHVTGGPEGGFFGAIGSTILDAGKAVGRGVEDVLSHGGPTPGTPGAVDTSEPKTSTTTQQ
jgi:hypothetical protein